MAFLDLLILQKLEILQNWNFTTSGISGFAILVDQHIDKNCLIHVQFYSFKDSIKENKQSRSLQFSEVRNSTKHTLFAYSVQDF